MNQTPTITIPISTAQKLAALGRAMVSLSEEMRQHALTKTTEPLPAFPIPDLTPPAQIPADQAWFWTDEWQKGEREVNEDIRAGRISRGHTSVDELFAELNRHV